MTDKDPEDAKSDRPDKETPGVTVESETATAELTESGAEVTESAAIDVVEAEAAGPVEAELTPTAESPGPVPKAAARSTVSWSGIVAFTLLPALALLLGAGAAYLKWEDSKVRDSDLARIESVQAAKESTARLLSYKPDSVEQDLTSARDLLTGNFRDSYTQLITDVVIPGAKEKKISALANVPAVASISADPNHAVALVFVNQTVVVGDGAPTSTNSSVQVTMDKVGDRWLISEFTPV